MNAEAVGGLDWLIKKKSLTIWKRHSPELKNMCYFCFLFLPNVFLARHRDFPVVWQSHTDMNEGSYYARLGDPV